MQLQPPRFKMTLSSVLLGIIILNVSIIFVLALFFPSMPRIAEESALPVKNAHASASAAPMPGNSLRDAPPPKNYFGTLAQALVGAAYGDTLGEELIGFHNGHATYTSLAGNGTTNRVLNGIGSTKSDKLAFEVTVASPEERATNNLVVISPWQWDAKHNEVFLPPPEKYTTEWAGILLSHVLSHAYDTHVRNEAPNTQRDIASMHGELRAWNLQIRLVQKLTKGAYRSQLITAIKIGKYNNFPIESWVKHEDIPQPVYALVNDVLPHHPKSDEERAARDKTVFIALNFLRIDILGGGDRTKQKFLLTLSDLDL